MHLNVSDIEIFTRDDNRLDRILKTSAFVISFLLFLNAFFGYWISLNKTEFGALTGNWGSFCFAVIIFYIAVKTCAFVGFLAVIYQWERTLLGVACSSGVLFFLGLLNVGLRANGFCFALLVLAALIYAILYLHLQSIEQCKGRGHHYTCRGSCIRHEKVKFVDDKVFRGKGSLVTLFGTGPVSLDGNPQGSGGNDTQITFTNEPEPSSANPNQSQDPWAPKDGGLSSQEAVRSLPATISTQVEINANVETESHLRRSTSQQHRRQASQGQSMSHLDASSLLQI